MFQQFYGFSRLPFSKDISPQDLFQAEGQQELCARLTYLVKERGLGLVTGETGSGKSTALRRFVASLDANRHFVIYLSNPLLGMSGLYREILTALGHEPLFSRPKMVARIRSVFEDMIQNKHRIPVVILDERMPSRIPLSIHSACFSAPRWTANPWVLCCWWAIPNCAAPCAWLPMRPSSSV